MEAFGTAVAERRIPRTLVLTGQAPKKRPALVISTEIQVWLANEFAFAVVESR